MKRKLTFVLTLAVLFSPATAFAQPLQAADPGPLFNLNVINPIQPPDILTVEPTKPADPPAKPDPKPVVYTVVEGDNLTKIGTDHNVKWQRLFDKNKQIDNPDLIHVGDKITIPLASEKLKHRDIPAATTLPAVTPGVASTAAPASFDGSNTYDYGYCTWYVKNRRGASLPNGLGNANTWYSRARAMGMAVGSTPAPGAVGTTTAGSLGHVVYVERVNRNGTIDISEMNYAGFGVVSHRTVSASEFLYIY